MMVEFLRLEQIFKPHLLNIVLEVKALCLPRVLMLCFG